MDRQVAELRYSQWEQIVLEANNSPISKREWCRKNGIREKTFYYWQRRIRLDALASAEASSQGIVPVKPSQSAFIEVPVAPAPAVESPVPSIGSPELMLQIGDCRVYVAGSIQESTLATVVRVIRNA